MRLPERAGGAIQPADGPTAVAEAFGRPPGAAGATGVKFTPMPYAGGAGLGLNNAWKLAVGDLDGNGEEDSCVRWRAWRARARDGVACM